MSEKPRKLEAMHRTYGMVEGMHCGDCPHLVRKEWGRHYFKCKGYGDTNCGSTDWAKSWGACGLITQEDISMYLPMVEQVKHSPRGKAVEEQIPGQVEMDLTGLA